MALVDPPVRPTSETSTDPDWRGLPAVRRARLIRRLLLAVFGTVLLLGATGWLGVRSGEVAASGGGYDLAVSYPRLTRAGHAVPLWVEVTKAGGFGKDPVMLRMTTDYFTLFDENGVQPAPSAETATGEDLVWEFDPPPGDTLRVYFDTRTGPNRQRGERAEVAVLVEDAPVVSVTFRTWVLP